MLTNSLRVYFPNTPSPPTSEVSNISAALDAALNVHVKRVFVPVGFGSTFISAVSIKTQFLINLSNFLDAGLSPIIAAALALENNPTSPMPHVGAWGSIQPSFDALSAAPPPFAAGTDGLKFWQAVLYTIRTAI